VIDLIRRSDQGRAERVINPPALSVSAVQSLFYEEIMAARNMNTTAELSTSQEPIVSRTITNPITEPADQPAHFLENRQCLHRGKQSL